MDICQHCYPPMVCHHCTAGKERGGGWGRALAIEIACQQNDRSVSALLVSLLETDASNFSFRGFCGISRLCTCKRAVLFVSFAGCVFELCLACASFFLALSVTRQSSVRCVSLNPTTCDFACKYL